MEKITIANGNGSIAVKRIIYWLLTVIFLAGIFMLSSQPASASNNLSRGIVEKGTETAAQIAPTVTKKINLRGFLTDEHLRNAAHSVVFSLLALFLTLALKTQGVRHPFLLTAGFCMLYGCFDELYQGYWIAGRGMQLSDMLRDWCGSLPIILLIYLQNKRVRPVDRKNIKSEVL